MSTATLVKAFAPFATKATIDTKERTFEGLLAAWSLDLGGDVIHRGAFAKTLQEWKASGGRRQIKLIDNHNYFSTEHALGRMLDAEERDEGLWAKWFVGRGQSGDELLYKIEDGIIDGLSIGYKTVPGKWEVIDGVRHLYELKLVEGSAVLFPMNPDALIDATSVKKLVKDMSPEDRAELRALLDGAAPEGTEEKGDDDFDVQAQDRLDRLRLSRLQISRAAKDALG